MKSYCTYILSNKTNSVLYAGVTNHLARRVWEHKKHTNPKSFTSQYNVNKLVFYCCGESIEGAIALEKSIKGGSRKNKIQLITESNPEWKDLSEEIGIQDILEN